MDNESGDKPRKAIKPQLRAATSFNDREAAALDHITRELLAGRKPRVEPMMLAALAGKVDSMKATLAHRKAMRDAWPRLGKQ